MPTRAAKPVPLTYPHLTYPILPSPLADWLCQIVPNSHHRRAVDSKDSPTPVTQAPTPNIQKIDEPEVMVEKNEGVVVEKNEVAQGQVEYIHVALLQFPT